MTIENQVEAINQLEEWFWSNYQKANQNNLFPVSSKWVYDLYNLKHKIKSASSYLDSDKPSLGLWGPSQAGKSAFLSKIIDLDDKNSLLMWTDDIFMYYGNNKYKELNPYDGGTDATACAIKYFLASNVVDVNNTIEVVISDLKDIMYSYSSGYYYTQKPKKENSDIEDYWEEGNFKKQINDILNNFNNTFDDAIDDKEAVKLLYDFVFTIDRLIDSEQEYFKRLRSNNFWNEFKNKLLTNKLLKSNKDITTKLLTNILWKDDEVLTKFFETSQQFIRDLENKVIYCNLDIASYIISMTSYSKDIESPEKPYEIAFANIIHNATLDKISSDESEYYIINQNGKDNKKLFGTKDKFLIFQNFIKELKIPLNSNKINNISKLEEHPLHYFNIIDLPGVSNKSKSNNDTNKEQNNMFIRQLKQGRILLLIDKYTNSFEIFALLLMIKLKETYDPVIKEFIKKGIERLRNQRKQLNGNEFNISINYTFFKYLLVKFLETSHTNPKDRLKDVIDDMNFNIKDTYNFITHYYWFLTEDDYYIKSLKSIDEIDTLFEHFMSNNWVKETFKSDIEKESIKKYFAHLKDVYQEKTINYDGGCNYILEQQKNIIKNIDYKSYKENIISFFNKEIQNAINKVKIDDNIEQINISIKNFNTKYTDIMKKIKEDIKNRDISKEDILELYYSFKNIYEIEAISNSSNNFTEILNEILTNHKNKLLENRFKYKDIEIDVNDINVIFSAIYLKVAEQIEKDNSSLNIKLNNLINNKNDDDYDNTIIRFISKYISNFFYIDNKDNIKLNFDSIRSLAEQQYKSLNNSFGIVNIYIEASIPKYYNILKNLFNTLEGVKLEGYTIDNKLLNKIENLIVTKKDEK